MGKPQSLKTLCPHLWWSCALGAISMIWLGATSSLYAQTADQPVAMDKLPVDILRPATDSSKNTCPQPRGYTECIELSTAPGPVMYSSDEPELTGWLNSGDGVDWNAPCLWIPYTQPCPTIHPLMFTHTKGKDVAWAVGGSLTVGAEIGLAKFLVTKVHGSASFVVERTGTHRYATHVAIPITMFMCHDAVVRPQHRELRVKGRARQWQVETVWQCRRGWFGWTDIIPVRCALQASNGNAERDSVFSHDTTYTECCDFDANPTCCGCGSAS